MRTLKNHHGHSWPSVSNLPVASLHPRFRISGNLLFVFSGVGKSPHTLTARPAWLTAHADPYQQHFRVLEADESIAGAKPGGSHGLPTNSFEQGGGV
jgi:hypothetical protein